MPNFSCLRRVAAKREIIKQATQLRGTAICDFDELSHDILFNQILKATLTNLAAVDDIHKELRHELSLLARQFHDVTDIRLSADLFRQATLSRNNRVYYFLKRLCEFVFLSLMPNEHGIGAKFQKFLDDEICMSAIFEKVSPQLLSSQSPRVLHRFL